MIHHDERIERTDMITRTSTTILTLLLCSLIRICAQTQVGNSILGNAQLDGTGDAVSINDAGDRIIVSADREDAMGLTTAGVVRVYALVGGAWSQLGADLVGETAGERFGKSVEMADSGERIALGGEAGTRVYDLVGTTWQQVGATIPLPSMGNGEHVQALRFSNDASILAIGIGNNDGSASVQVFEWNSGSWSQRGSDLPEPFGYDVALSGDGQRLAVPYGDWPDPVQLIVLDFNGTDWELVGDTIRPLTGYEFTEGFDLSDDGDRLVGFMITESTEDGIISTYDLVGGDWTTTLPPFTSQVDNPQGTSLRMADDGNAFVLGTADDGINFDSTYVVMFRSNGSQWSYFGTVFRGVGSDETAQGHTGITGDGSRIVWGAKEDAIGSRIGIVQVYDYSTVISVEETGDAFDLEVYPNPAHGRMTVVNMQGDLVQLRLFDARGCTVLERSAPRGLIALDVAGLSPGVHMLVGQRKDGTMLRQRVVLQGRMY